MSHLNKAGNLVIIQNWIIAFLIAKKLGSS